MTRDQQISRALQLLDPPRGDREKWREYIDVALTSVDGATKVSSHDKTVRSQKGKDSLNKYISALTKTRDARKDLDASLRQGSYSGFLVQMVINDELEKAEAMLDQPSRPRARSKNARGRIAVELAWRLLELRFRKQKPTTTRGRAWDQLAKVLANSDTDLLNFMRDFKEQISEDPDLLYYPTASH